LFGQVCKFCTKENYGSNSIQIEFYEGCIVRIESIENVLLNFVFDSAFGYQRILRLYFGNFMFTEEAIESLMFAIKCRDDRDEHDLHRWADDGGPVPDDE